MIYRIRHTTRYHYAETVSQCYSVTHLLPRATPFQDCRKEQIQVDPLPVSAAYRDDYFGNRSYHFSVQVPHQMLEVTATSEVDVLAQSMNLSLDFSASCGDVRAMLADSAGSADTLLAREFTLDSAMVSAGQELAAYAGSSFSDDRPFLAAVSELTRRIFDDFTYDPRSTEIATPLQEVLAQRRGVCQDFAHLAIGCLRSLGFPARYVSGYLETLPPPGSPRLEGVDASHAWFAVYIPDQGWWDFDPTNNLLPAGQHITTAWGRDYADVTPLKGAVFGHDTRHSLEVEVDVARL